MVVEDEIEYINQIIEQFLDFARPSGPRKEKADIHQLIEETLLIMMYEIKEHDIEVDKSLWPMPPVLANKDKMKQVFLNLILNAMQAMSECGKADHFNCQGWG